MRRLLASLCAAALIFFVTTPARALSVSTGVISDDFNDGNTDGWEFPYNAGMSQGPGDWAVDGGELVQRFFGDSNNALVKDYILSDQNISVNAETQGYAGIVLWYQQIDGSMANYVSVNYNYQTGLEVREEINGQTFRSIYGGPWIGSDFNLLLEADSATGLLTVQIASHINTNQGSLSHYANTPIRAGLSGVFSGNHFGRFDDLLIVSDDINPVPEPGTMCLLGSGLVGLAGYGRKRRKA